MSLLNYTTAIQDALKYLERIAVALEGLQGSVTAEISKPLSEAEQTRVIQQIMTSLFGKKPTQ